MPPHWRTWGCALLTCALHPLREIFAGSLATSGAEPDFTLVQLQQYIKFARSIKPVMSPEAARKLVEYYRELRQSSETDANTG